MVFHGSCFVLMAAYLMAEFQQGSIFIQWRVQYQVHTLVKAQQLSLHACQLGSVSAQSVSPQQPQLWMSVMVRAIAVLLVYLCLLEETMNEASVLTLGQYMWALMEQPQSLGLEHHCAWLLLFQRWIHGYVCCSNGSDICGVSGGLSVEVRHVQNVSDSRAQGRVRAS